MDQPDRPRRDDTETFDPKAIERVDRARRMALSMPRFSGFSLVVVDGPQKGFHWELEDGVHEAGRDPEALLFFDDVSVSRHHARFTVGDDTLTVDDLDSTNGTYVNGERVEAVELQNGDELLVGRYHLVVVHSA